MGNLTLFLSHIHEEKELAKVIQAAIEDEFGGFISVFVSSDGKTIPAGSNLLKVIENGLLTCVGALYLISPKSVKRNWINFELGAVWIRSLTSQNQGGPQIPTIPICHSGMALADLPMPLSSLNAIQGNIASQLEFAFRSIQTAVGGKGRLKTDFDLLEKDIKEIEKIYTLGAKIVELFSLIGTEAGSGINYPKLSAHVKKIVKQAKEKKDAEYLSMPIDAVETERINRLRVLEQNELKGYIKLELGIAGTFGGQGPFSTVNGQVVLPIVGAEVAIIIQTTFFLEYADLLLETFK